MARARAVLEDVLRRLTAAAEAERVVHEATAPVEHRSLCVAMATYDDFDGVWFTVKSVLLHHREVRDRINFLILDNHPRGESAAALKALDGQVPQLRYVPFDGYKGTAVRDLLFRGADADVVCCVDAHVLLAPGALTALLDHFDRDRASRRVRRRASTPGRCAGPSARRPSAVGGRVAGRRAARQRPPAVAGAVGRRERPRLVAPAARRRRRADRRSSRRRHPARRPPATSTRPQRAAQRRPARPAR